MAIFTIDLSQYESFLFTDMNMIKDIYKYLTILIFVHILTNFTKLKNYGFSGELFNENFCVFLLIVAIAIMAYFLVVKEILDLN